MLSIGCVIFCLDKGFRLRTESDLVLFLILPNNPENIKAKSRKYRGVFELYNYKNETNHPISSNSHP